MKQENTKGRKRKKIESIHYVVAEFIYGGKEYQQYVLMVFVLNTQGK